MPLPGTTPFLAYVGFTMQPHPVRTFLPSRTRVVRAALAVCATAATLPLASGSVSFNAMRSRSGAAAGVSGGNVAAVLAPTLPQRTHPQLDRVLAGTPGSALDAPAPVALTVRERLALGAAGTYIGDLLRQRDSAVVRWPDRVDNPIAVWVSRPVGLADWHPAYVGRVVDAFGDWTRTGVPVRFRFVPDSGAAEVHVSWTDHFREPISGRTVWSRNEHWWMTDANITIALHHNDGAPLDEEQVRAIALHEVGHLLGLDHTTDPTSVMAARVRVRDLSSADQATARLVYTVPAGHL